MMRCPVSARTRIWRRAVTIAVSSGTAIRPRPTSIKPLSDLGRAHCMDAFYRGGVLTVCNQRQPVGRWRQGPCRGAPVAGSLGQPALPRVLLKLPLPFEGGEDNGVEIVEPRPPAELAADALGARDERRRVARATRLLADVELCTRRALDRGEHLAHAVAVTIAHIERGGRATAAQIVERVDVRGGEVADVQVVAYAGAVGGG